MTKQLCLIIMWFMTYGSTAQTWNVGRYLDTEYAIYMMQTPFGIDMVTQGQTYQRVYRYNQNGQLVFETTQHHWTKQPMVNYVGEIITITNRNGCDYGMGEPYVKTVKKINLLGQSATTYTFLSSNNDEYMPLVLLPDSGYVAIADTVLVRFNKTHQYVSRKNLGMGGTIWAQVINNRIIISGTTTAGPTLQFLNMNLQTTDNYTVPTYFTKAVTINPTLTLLQGYNNQLYKLYDTSSLSAPFKIGNKLVEDFVVTHDSIIAILKNGSKSNQLAIGDLNGNMLWSYTANEASTNFKKIEISNGHLVHCNTQLASKYNHGFIFLGPTQQIALNKGSINNPEPSPMDIELLNLQFDSTYLIFDSYSKTVRTKVKYTVKNNSNTTITNFQLSSYSSEYVACGHHFETQKVTTNIPANTTQTFTSNWFSSSYLRIPSSPVPDPFPFNKCYYLTLPNGFTDTKLSDNESCVNGIATDLKDEHLDIVFKILPNPANNQLHILSEKLIERLVVTDITGKVVMTATPQAESSLLDSSSLPNGIYFVHCKTANGTSTNKIIIQH